MFNSVWQKLAIDNRSLEFNNTTNSTAKTIMTLAILYIFDSVSQVNSGINKSGNFHIPNPNHYVKTIVVYPLSIYGDKNLKEHLKKCQI